MTDRSLHPIQRFSIDAIRKVEREILDTFMNLALGISNDVRFVNQPVDDGAKLRILKSVDDQLDAVYGASRTTATNSRLFRIVSSATDQVGEATLMYAVNEIKNLIDARDPALWNQFARAVINQGEDSDLEFLLRMFEGEAAARERVVRSGLLDPNRAWVSSDGYRLSDRIWRRRAETRRDIDQLITQAIAEGKDPLELAEDLEQYLDPHSRATVSMRSDGTEVVSNITRAPRRGGIGNYHARRLAVTEIQRVNAAAAIHAAKTVPGIQGVQWELSNRHVVQDRCDDHAEGSSEGFPSGVYLPDEAPTIPDHPWCRCVWLYSFDQSTDWIDNIVDELLLSVA